MVTIRINNQTIQAEKGTTIMEAARQAGIEIPSLCYLKDINEIAACRICVVELEGCEGLVTACNTKVEDGMVLYTNSPKVRAARKMNLELILSQHDSRCASCVRSGNCTLQKLANDQGILEVPYETQLPKETWNKKSPIIRDGAKCIKCMRCVQICDKVQDLQVWDVVRTGGRTTVGVRDGLVMKDAGCVLCGQCITHCPVGALRERDDVQKVFDALADPDKITVVQIAPAVRAAWGEGIGLAKEEATTGKLVSALRKMGFNYIFDTNFSADLTIMEESTEFLHRLQNLGKSKMPMFTSCCPGWMSFLRTQYPELAENASSAKSPQQMFGAIAKSYYAKLLNVDPSAIYCVSIMPCLAKKAECTLPGMDSCKTGQDVDVVLTTREVDRMIRAEHICAETLQEEAFDQPLGTSTGAAVIFGATGGVMEAALRSAYYLVTGENPQADAFKNVRGLEGWKEAQYEIAGTVLKVAVVSGLSNTRKLIQALKRGDVTYDFVEVMACPGGCAGGGGQPIHDGMELAGERGAQLYQLDNACELRFSHENPAVQAVYKDFLGAPLSELAHELLHT